MTDDNTSANVPDDRPLIYYVDDEEANRVVFLQSFKRRFRIVTVEDPVQALKAMSEVEPAVVVTDQRMPFMSGNELLDRVKTLYPQAVRIVVTAYSDLDNILQAVNQGLVARYVIKPWDRSEVDAMLGWATDTYGVGHENADLQMRIYENERLATLGTVTAGLLHDMSHPISYLLTNAEVLQEMAAEAADDLSGVMNQFGKRIDEDVRGRISDLVTELPDMAADMVYGAHVLSETTGALRQIMMAEGGKETAGTDPLRVVRYVQGLCDGMAHDNDTVIGYHGPNALPAVGIKQSALTRVLINLTNNAIQGCIGRDEPGRMVTLRGEADAEAVTLLVIDNGVGMDPGLFERLGSAARVTTKATGSGIGVQQSKKLVEEAGGDLAFESQVGHGTRVSVRLPLFGLGEG